MHTSRSSASAETNAAVRALEALRPAGQRICFDPYAKFFLSDHLLRAPDLSTGLEQLIADWEMRFPGVCNAILARTRFIDDCLTHSLADNLQQLVILGAGYDTRSLRFDTFRRGIAVFELDHPATQTEKLRRFQRFFSPPRSGVTYIPVLFGQEELTGKLFKEGYDGQKPTLFIWEGVTYYLSATVVDAILACIAHNAPVGSTVAFDYFPPSMATGSSRRMEGRLLYQALKQKGEPIRFGLEPHRMASFLNRRGFDLVDHLSMGDCKRLYFSGANRSRQVSDIFSFIHARVKGTQPREQRQRRGAG